MRDEVRAQCGEHAGVLPRAELQASRHHQLSSPSSGALARFRLASFMRVNRERKQCLAVMVLRAMRQSSNDTPY